MGNSIIDPLVSPGTLVEASTNSTRVALEIQAGVNSIWTFWASHQLYYLLMARLLHLTLGLMIESGLKVIGQ